MFQHKLFSLSIMALLGAVQVGCIVSKSDSTQASETSDVKKQDNVPAQSIDRDYISGYDDHYDHGGGYGLGSHASYGIPEGYGDNYGGYEGGKHHGHHLEDHHHHHHHGYHHKNNHDYGYHKTLAIKGLLVPLAGVALLGAAAAFVSNPILLQLGVISGAPLGRRKRETNFQEDSISEENQIRLNEIKLLERFMAQILPGKSDILAVIYPSYSKPEFVSPEADDFVTQVPKGEILNQEKKILASYLSCSGATTTENLCLERLACELHSPMGFSMPMEANVFKIVFDEILNNDFVPEEKKKRISDAIQRGKNDSGCFVFKCEVLENRIFNSNLDENSPKKQKKIIFDTKEMKISDEYPRT